MFLISFAVLSVILLVTRRDENEITAVEAAALHHELVVDPLRWFDDFAVEKYWHSSDSFCQQLRGLTQTLVHCLGGRLIW